MKIAVQLHPSHIAWPFHKVFTVPYMKVDDKVTHTKWGATNTIDLGEGDTLSAGFSYWFNLDQRLAESRFAVPRGGAARITGRLGPFNSSPFHFRAE